MTISALRRSSPCAALLFVCGIGAAETADRSWESAELHIVLSPRTPDQMAAFYEARGFAPDMIEVLRQQCFITVLIENRSSQTLWLDLDQWTFRNGDGGIVRPHRDRWRERWQSMGVPLAHQSTFRWTLLPERLDFQPGEREGGNIVLPRLGKAFAIHARFDAGDHRTGGPIRVEFDDVHCAEDTE